MNLATLLAILPALLQLLTALVQGVEQLSADSPIQPAGPEKRNAVLDAVSNLWPLFRQANPKAPELGVVQATLGALVDTTVTLHNALGVFRHRSSAPPA